jgi:hypothetical protein
MERRDEGGSVMNYQWKPSSTVVAIAHTSFTWEREIEGSTQHLTILVWNTDKMDLIAEETWDGVHTYRCIDRHKRDYVCTNDEITYFFKKAMMKGDGK